MRLVILLEKASWKVTLGILKGHSFSYG